MTQACNAINGTYQKIITDFGEVIVSVPKELNKTVVTEMNKGLKDTYAVIDDITRGTEKVLNAPIIVLNDIMADLRALIDLLRKVGFGNIFYVMGLTILPFMNAAALRLNSIFGTNIPIKTIILTMFIIMGIIGIGLIYSFVKVSANMTAINVAMIAFIFTVQTIGL